MTEEGYDAYSQAVSVLANNIAGLRDCIENGIRSETCSQPDSRRNAPAAVAAFVNYVGAIKKVGDTCTPGDRSSLLDGYNLS